MIVVFGSINVDLIFAAERLPGPGETVLGPAVAIQPGGKGANQAVAAARDGAAVTMVGAVGDDALAEAALALLRAARVDLTRVATVAGSTGCAAIVTDPAGRNQIAVGSGANRAVRASQVEAGLLGPGSTVVLQMEVDAGETAALVQRARAAGSRIVLNLAPAAALDLAALRALDCLVVNEHEAHWLGGRLGVAPAGLHEVLGVTVVRTLGERGAAHAGPGGSGQIEAVAITAVDTTAAGDCFTGVLAAGLDRGLALPAALMRANRAAAVCCTRAGSQSSLPSADEIDGFARKHT